ncbi:DUF1801 domain-containing protein [Planococcus beigongshangi]|uniref:DUF1801 domain-containing protein n=1 Tax=Planococcus beigongshangi TaxID=2782536 RepID=UPI00193BE58A|nr:DUF1801 domain-containing protein [Planococcus beigongshangi]
MYEQKTTQNDADVIEFIEQVENPKKRQDAYRLLEIFEELSGHPAKMWGPSIIGFGSYHYVYATGHEGDAPLVGFSPRKAKISLYIGTSEGENEPLLKDLGKHTSGKSCVYVNKLADIDEEALKKMIVKSIADIQMLYPS